jgi:hypothetical protein
MNEKHISVCPYVPPHKSLSDIGRHFGFILINTGQLQTELDNKMKSKPSQEWLIARKTGTALIRPVTFTKHSDIGLQGEHYVTTLRNISPFD